MPWFDLPEHELRAYRTSTPEPDGLDTWWAQRIDDARSAARETALRRHEPGTYGRVAVYDVEFSGAHGHRVRGWFLLPASEGPVPVVVTYVGYGGGRGVPVEHLALPAAGIAAFVMDTRGQGGGWTVGATGDPGAPGGDARWPTSSPSTWTT
jgi:cephalosporin-C deacetylase